MKPVRVTRDKPVRVTRDKPVRIARLIILNSLVGGVYATR